jgi:tRNA (guanine37-N1)-methyltransferase
VLLSGHHAKIKEWRRLKSLEITNRYRLDLIEKAREDGNLSVQDEKWLATLENKVIKED